MFKRFLALFALTALIFSMGVSIFAEPVENSEQSQQVEQDEQANDLSEPHLPTLQITLNSDGTTDTTFNQQMNSAELEQTLPYVEQSFTNMGYTVTKNDNPTSLSISKQYPAEDGYVLDFNLPYNVGMYEFVEFKEFFSSRYGIKNSSFNLENQPEGQVYLTITVNTPVKPIHSNAQAISNGGKTHVWTISSGQKNAIELNFKKINIVPTITAIFIAAVLLILLFALTKSRKDAGNTLPSDIDASADEIALTEEEMELFEESDENSDDNLELEEILDEVAEEAGLDINEELSENFDTEDTAEN